MELFDEWCVCVCATVLDDEKKKTTLERNEIINVFTTSSAAQRTLSSMPSGLMHRHWNDHNTTIQYNRAD